jgi:hypothetical protein
MRSPVAALMILILRSWASTRTRVPAWVRPMPMWCAADFVMVLTRARTEKPALLRIAGRDVAEAGYSLLFDDGIWSTNGTGLSDAAQRVQGPRLAATMQSVLALVNSRGTTVLADVSHLLDIETAGRYLRHLADYALITRTERGRYSPNSLSDCPFPESAQVKD